MLLAFRGFHSLHSLHRLRLVLVVRSLDRLLKIGAPLEDKASVELVLLVSLMQLIPLAFLWLLPEGSASNVSEKDDAKKD